MKVRNLIFLITIFSSFNIFASNDTLFFPRKQPIIVELRGRLWMIGGGRGDAVGAPLDYNDVWVSDNGKAWNRAAWEVTGEHRSGYGCASFEKKIWIVGGFSIENQSYLNDVWYTKNGVDWEKARISAEFPGRTNANLIVFNKRLYLIGGSGADGIKFSEIWVTDNGYEWELLTDKLPFVSLARDRVVVFKDKLFVVSPENGIFSSADGINWEKLSTTELVTKRIGFSVVVKDDLLYLIGGEVYSRTGYYNDIVNEVWSSEDGINWKQRSPYPPGRNDNPESYFCFKPPRRDHTSFVYKDRIFILGGVTNWGRLYLNDIWISPLGERWVQIR